MVAGNRLVGRADDLPFSVYSHYGPNPSAHDCRLRQTLESKWYSSPDRQSYSSNLLQLNFRFLSVPSTLAGVSCSVAGAGAQ